MSENDELLKTALHDRHVAAAARMGPWEGWNMPLDYGDADGEVAEVRSRAGVFDISHLGRIRIRGDGAVDLLERLCTSDAARQEDDTAAVTLLCNDAGCIIDAGILIRLENDWVLTCSAGGRQKVLEHVQANAADFDVKVSDQTRNTVHICTCGQAAARILDAVLPEKVSSLPRGAAKIGSFVVARYIAARTGYTNLWSLEVILPNMLAQQAWSFITAKAGANAIRPAGMTAREILRKEASLPRRGPDFDDTTDPITAGLERAVNFNHDFLGRDAIGKIKQARGGPA